MGGEELLRLGIVGGVEEREWDSSVSVSPSGFNKVKGIGESCAAGGVFGIVGALALGVIGRIEAQIYN